MINLSTHKANNLGHPIHQKTLDFSCIGQKILKPLAKEYSIKKYPKECKY
jgi:hypothetical protein